MRAVSWTGGCPHLDVLDLATRARRAVPLVGATVAFSVVGAGRYCTGYSAFGEDGGLRMRDCAGDRLAVAGGRCVECGAADQFRFVHHVHRGGYVPEGMREYVDRPHWVYIATFADASNKVGTVTHLRKRARLDEQGAVRATYLAWAATGVTAREYEDLVSGSLDVTQAKRRRAKLAALARPRPAGEIEDAHAAAVDAARAVLAESAAVLPLERWQPPPEHAGFATAGTSITEYPHALTAGDHRLSVVAMIGSAALVSVNEDDGLFVADLGALTGLRLTPGPVRSRPAAAQLGLF